MVNAWPSDVPTSAAAGTLTETLDEGVSKFTPEAGGPPLLRSRSSVVNSVLTYDTIPVDSATFDSLWVFYLANKALVFTRVHPDPNVTGTKNWQFEAPPKRRHSFNDLHTISIAIRLRP